LGQSVFQIKSGAGLGGLALLSLPPNFEIYKRQKGNFSQIRRNAKSRFFSDKFFIFQNLNYYSDAEKMNLARRHLKRLKNSRQNQRMVVFLLLLWALFFLAPWRLCEKSRSLVGGAITLKDAAMP
jgi:hypothetical protein